ncbi:MAG: ATP-grasp domain-containing protein [Candidatus Helarchaeota archaeon]
MNKILLLDTNFSAKPIYDYLVATGNEIFVVGLGGKPKYSLAKSAKNYINLDYSNIEKIQELIELKSIDYIIPGCNDLSYKICAKLNSENRFYGLDPLEKVETINDKEKFKKFAKKVGLPSIKIISYNEVRNYLPIIIKPVDSYSGQGITIIRKYNDDILNKAIDLAKKYSTKNKYIIEEYIDGQLYSHSAFIKDNKILIDFIVEEHCTANPFVVDTSRVIYNFNKKVKSKIREAIELMAKKLNLVDGLIHTQFIKKGDSFWIVEVTRRCPGDLYSLLIEFSTGFRYAESYTKPFLGESINLSNQTSNKKYILRHTISQSNEGIYNSLKFLSPVQIEKFIPLSLTGDKVKGSPFSRIGLLFLRANSERELIDLFKKTLNRELYLIH